jgi:hypothetical protein
MKRQCLACAIATEEASDRTSAHFEAERSNQDAISDLDVEVRATQYH